MGNYATREEREPLVSKWAAQCGKERLSLQEGRCIVEAPEEDDIAACPRPLVPELVGDPKGCERIGERAAEMIERAAGDDEDMRPIVNVIDEVPGAVKGLCMEGGGRRREGVSVGAEDFEWAALSGDDRSGARRAAGQAVRW
jgi:hypothetical protein